MRGSNLAASLSSAVIEQTVHIQLTSHELPNQRYRLYAQSLRAKAETSH